MHWLCLVTKIAFQELWGQRGWWCAGATSSQPVFTQDRFVSRAKEKRMAFFFPLYGEQMEETFGLCGTRGDIIKTLPSHMRVQLSCFITSRVWIWASASEQLVARCETAASRYDKTPTFPVTSCIDCNIIITIFPIPSFQKKKIENTPGHSVSLPSACTAPWAWTSRHSARAPVWAGEAPEAWRTSGCCGTRRWRRKARQWPAGWPHWEQGCTGSPCCCHRTFPYDLQGLIKSQ